MVLGCGQGISVEDKDCGMGGWGWLVVGRGWMMDKG